MCDSQKNVLHDLFWASIPPPDEILNSMVKAVEMLLEVVGRKNVLCLLLSKDKFGYAPTDYVKPDLQTNWVDIFRLIVCWNPEEQPRKRLRTWQPTGNTRQSADHTMVSCKQ